MVDSRGIRLNNPLNIRKSNIDWQGEVPSTDKSFEEFSTARLGIRAACKILLTYCNKYNLRSIRQIVNRWAPPVENPTDNYVKYVALKVGVSDTEILDLYDLKVLVPFARSMIEFENGYCPYSTELIKDAAISAISSSPRKQTVGVSA